MEFDFSVAESLSLFSSNTTRSNSDNNASTSGTLADIPASVGAGLKAEGVSNSSDSNTAAESAATDTSATNFSSLFSMLNDTKTAMGAKLLKQWLLRPARTLRTITARHDCVQWLVERPRVLNALREQTTCLLRYPDLDKIGELLDEYIRQILF